MPSHIAHVTNFGPNSSRYGNPEGDPVEKAYFDNSAMNSVDSLTIISEKASVEGNVQADEEVDESNDHCVLDRCFKLIFFRKLERLDGRKGMRAYEKSWRVEGGQGRMRTNRQGNIQTLWRPII